MESKNNNFDFKNPEYNFSSHRDFAFIEKNVGQKFSKNELEDINKLLHTDKEKVISNFHNFFSLNETNSLKEIERMISGIGFVNLDQEEKETFLIFHNFLEKYGWTVCLNIESFIEEYKE